MEKNEFKQVLKNNVSELIALQEQCQNTDVKCAQSILNTILWMKEINEDIEGEIMGQRKSTGGVFYFIVFCIFAL